MLWTDRIGGCNRYMPLRTTTAGRTEDSSLSTSLTTVLSCQETPPMMTLGPLLVLLGLGMVSRRVVMFSQAVVDVSEDTNTLGEKLLHWTTHKLTYFERILCYMCVSETQKTNKGTTPGLRTLRKTL